jgi:hypothetical protein
MPVEFLADERNENLAGCDGPGVSRDPCELNFSA